MTASMPVPKVEGMPSEWDWRPYGIVTTPRNQVNHSLQSIFNYSNDVLPLHRANAARVGVLPPQLFLKVIIAIIY